jgi:hypothetical protein
MKKLVQLNSINELQTGDIVRGKVNHQTYTVVANFGTRATAVRVADITNPIEWQVLREVNEENQ